MLESLVWKKVERKVLGRNKTNFFKKADNLGGVSDHWKKKNFLRFLNAKIVVKVSGEVEISCEILKSETESINSDPFSQYSYGELSGGICLRSAD
jgi:hypothetical protein